MSEEAFPHLDHLRQAYDRDAGRRSQLEDLQWRPEVLDGCDVTFGALEFEGFEATRRELLTNHAADGLHPQLLVLRRRGA